MPGRRCGQPLLSKCQEDGCSGTGVAPATLSKCLFRCRPLHRTVWLDSRALVHDRAGRIRVGGGLMVKPWSTGSSRPEASQSISVIEWWTLWNLQRSAIWWVARPAQ